MQDSRTLVQTVYLQADKHFFNFAYYFAAIESIVKKHEVLRQHQMTQFWYSHGIDPEILQLQNFLKCDAQVSLKIGDFQVARALVRSFAHMKTLQKDEGESEINVNLPQKEASADHVSSQDHHELKEYSNCPNLITDEEDKLITAFLRYTKSILN